MTKFVDKECIDCCLCMLRLRRYFRLNIFLSNFLSIYLEGSHESWHMDFYFMVPFYLDGWSSRKMQFMVKHFQQAAATCKNMKILDFFCIS